MLQYQLLWFFPLSFFHFYLLTFSIRLSSLPFPAILELLGPSFALSASSPFPSWLSSPCVFSFSFFFFFYSPHFPNSFIICKLVQFSLVCQAPLLPTKGPAFRFYFYLLFLQPISTSKRLTCPLLKPKWIVSTKRSISASPAASHQRLPVLTLGYCFSEISAEEGILSSNAPTAHATSQLRWILFFPIFPLSLVLTGITLQVNYLQFPFTKQH